MQHYINPAESKQSNTAVQMLSRAALFHKSAVHNHEFERYLTSSEPASMKFNDIVIDSTRGYVIVLPLSYFISNKSTPNHRLKGKADAMPYESFRIINIQHRGGNAHSLVLIKSRAIRSNPHHIAIFESNGRNRFCGIRILDDHIKIINKTQTKSGSKIKPQPTLKNVTKAYTSISPEYNINYGTNTYNPGYCGIFGIICVVAFRCYRSKTGAVWLAKWTKLLTCMSQCIDRSTGCVGVELAARVQEIIASNACSCAEREIAALIRSSVAVKQTSSCSLVL